MNVSGDRKMSLYGDATDFFPSTSPPKDFTLWAHKPSNFLTCRSIRHFLRALHVWLIRPVYKAMYMQLFELSQTPSTRDTSTDLFNHGLGKGSGACVTTNGASIATIFATRVTNMILSLRTYVNFPGSYMRMGTTGESSLPYTMKPNSLSLFRKYLGKRKIRGELMRYGERNAVGK